MDVLARESMRQIIHRCTLETPHQLGGNKQWEVRNRLQWEVLMLTHRPMSHSVNTGLCVNSAAKAFPSKTGTGAL